MPRNMSFTLTTQQIKDRTKTVTRRLGWRFLKPGDLITACEKCQGIKKGEKVVKLATLRVVSQRREPLSALIHDTCYGAYEMQREGFPDMVAREFIDMFRTANNCDYPVDVTRIEFEYVDESQRSEG